MRCFLAIRLPDAAREAVAAVQRRLALAKADVKWVEPPNLHVTMKFLGEIGDEVRRTLEASLAPIAREIPPFTLALDQAGAFPSTTAPRVLWVGVGQGREALTRLAEAIEAACRALGQSGEPRPFAAHVTLGRVRSPRGRAALVSALRSFRWQPPPPWTAHTLTLYESRLSPAGPTYRVVAEWSLGAEDVSAPR